jgi:hypothetical protein
VSHASPEFERAVDGVEERLLAGCVSLGALEPPALGPPSVAVHHAGHVGRQMAGIDALGERAVAKHAPHATA